MEQLRAVSPNDFFSPRLSEFRQGSSVAIDARGRYMPFVETLNEDHQKLLTGSSQYGGGRSARDLAEPREHTGWGLGVNAPPS